MTMAYCMADEQHVSNARPVSAVAASCNVTVHRYVSACLTAFVSLFAGQLSLLTSAGWKMITRQSVAKLRGYGQKQVRLIPTVD